MLQTNEKDNKKIEYIALYCRVDSANSQVNTLGILTQKKKIEYRPFFGRFVSPTIKYNIVGIKTNKTRLALWAEQQGFTPEQIIYLVDSGFSGRTLDRPGIQKFLSGDRKYAIMAAMDFSRFSRDLFLADELIDYADTQGTTLYVLNQDISLNQWKRERDQRLYALLKGGAAQ